jgi:GNAT superfamily N-acetyltransferase
MQILKADMTHLENVSALFSACGRHLVGAGIHQWDEHYPDRDTLLHDLDNEELYVAINSGEMVGSVTLNQKEDPEYSRMTWRTLSPSLIVHRLCVFPALQGRGIGSGLMGFAEQVAREARCNSIRLDVYSENLTAVTLYKHLGFSFTGQFMCPNRAYPFHCMEKRIEY